MKKFALIVLACAATGALRAGIAVDAQTDVPRRICTNEVTLAWDWNWDWVPPGVPQSSYTCVPQQ